MIKNRDFWMPFAPTHPRASATDDYLVNPKGLASPYMMLAFATNPKRRDDLVAAVHPHDGTARPHIVEEEWNPGVPPRDPRVRAPDRHRRGAEHVVQPARRAAGRSAEDAVDTFERSGLPHLALGRFLISKR